MPSFEHELIVDLFRAAPELAPRLLSDVFGHKLPEGPVRVGSADLSQAAPASFFADVVVHVGGRSEHPASAVVVEVQRGRDASKRFVWSAYLGNEFARRRCPVWLLVVAPDEAMARWCAEPIAMGHPGLVLEPLVVHPALVPEVTDVAEAVRLPELAVLSAVVHGDSPRALAIGQAVIEASVHLDEDRRKLYVDATLLALNEVARGLLEAWMQKHEYRSEFARKYVAEGRIAGRAEGSVEALVDLAVQLAAAKLGAMPDGLAERLRHGADLGRLRQLTMELGLARDAAEVEAALERHLGG